jgi:hypothetical protein
MSKDEEQKIKEWVRKNLLIVGDKIQFSRIKVGKAKK